MSDLKIDDKGDLTPTTLTEWQRGVLERGGVIHGDGVGPATGIMYTSHRVLEDVESVLTVEFDQCTHANEPIERATHRAMAFRERARQTKGKR